MVKDLNKALQLYFRLTSIKSEISQFSFFLFAFLLFFCQSIYSIDKNLYVLNTQNTSYNSTQSNFQNYHHNHPLSSTTQANVQQSFNENELRESTNQQFIITGSNVLFEELKLITGLNFYLHQITQLLHNRRIVALFVLHHSWKIFFAN